MNRNMVRHDLACAIWTTWMTWLREQPDVPVQLWADWDHLINKEPAYRMADAALAAIEEPLSHQG